MVDLDAASRKLAGRVLEVLLKGEPLSKHNAVEIGSRALKALGADPTALHASTTSHTDSKKEEY